MEGGNGKFKFVCELGKKRYIIWRERYAVDTHPNHAVDVDGLVTVVLDLDAPPEHIHQRFPLEVLGEITQVGPLARERFGAIRVLFLLDDPCSVVSLTERPLGVHACARIHTT